MPFFYNWIVSRLVIKQSDLLINQISKQKELAVSKTVAEGVKRVLETKGMSKGVTFICYTLLGIINFGKQI